MPRSQPVYQDEARSLESADCRMGRARMTVCPVEIDFNEARINRKIKYKQKPVTSSELTSLPESKGSPQLSESLLEREASSVWLLMIPLSTSAPVWAKESFFSI